jgi:NADPH:quinone reductase-like Zn-dependent oxidoreductase
MRAIVIEQFGGPDALVYKELPEPQPKAGYVVIAMGWSKPAPAANSPSERKSQR